MSYFELRHIVIIIVSTFMFFNSNGTVSGRELLDLQDFNPDWMFYDWIGLFVYICIFLTLTYITLRLIKKDK